MTSGRKDLWEALNASSAGMQSGRKEELWVAFNALSKSVMRSAQLSIPTDSRMRESSIPNEARCSSEIDACAVRLGHSGVNKIRK